MREIIPLKKDIVFKSKIGELSNLNLDHDYKINEDIVNGTVALSGTYKMTEASVLEDDFYYTIPFSIAISKRINKDTIKIEIDDFKYEIEKDTLKVNIDLEFTCEELEEVMDNKEPQELEEILEQDKTNDTDDFLNEYFNDTKINLNKEDVKTDVNNVKNDTNVDENINNITQNLLNTDNKYYTYKVYIVRGGDTVESICSKYNVTYEDLKNYNNLSDLNVGDKIIIPSFNE